MPLENVRIMKPVTGRPKKAGAIPGTTVAASTSEPTETASPFAAGSGFRLDRTAAEQFLELLGANALAMVFDFDDQPVFSRERANDDFRILSRILHRVRN